MISLILGMILMVFCIYFYITREEEPIVYDDFNKEKMTGYIDILDLLFFLALGLILSGVIL
jgi:hypothetical protein